MSRETLPDFSDIVPHILFLFFLWARPRGAQGLRLALSSFLGTIWDAGIGPQLEACNVLSLQPIYSTNLNQSRVS